MTTRGSYEKGRQRREEFVHTALEVLAEHGYRQTSLRAIGRVLGVQPAHILHYFPNKEALLEAVITHWDEQSAATGAGDERPFLARWPDGVAYNAGVPGLVHLYTAFAAEAADPQHPSREFFRRRFDRVRALIVEDLERMRAEGRIDDGLDLDRTALRLMSFSDGLQLHWLIDPSIDMAAELRLAIATIVGVRPA